MPIKADTNKANIKRAIPVDQKTNMFKYFSEEEHANDTTVWDIRKSSYFYTLAVWEFSYENFDVYLLSAL